MICYRWNISLSICTQYEQIYSLLLTQVINFRIVANDVILATVAVVAVALLPPAAAAVSALSALATLLLLLLIHIIAVASAAVASAVASVASAVASAIASLASPLLLFKVLCVLLLNLPGGLLVKVNQPLLHSLKGVAILRNISLLKNKTEQQLFYLSRKIRVIIKPCVLDFAKSRNI